MNDYIISKQGVSMLIRERLKEIKSKWGVKNPNLECSGPFVLGWDIGCPDGDWSATCLASKK